MTAKPAESATPTNEPIVLSNLEAWMGMFQSPEEKLTICEGAVIWERTCNRDLRNRLAAAQSELSSARADAERNGAAANIVLALVTLKFHKDRIGKDATYETEQPKAWALAKEFLKAAMPTEYATIDEAIRRAGEGKK